MRRILLVRHGQSEGNVDEARYMAVGDPQIELTTLGWQQALSAGKFLAHYYRNSPPEEGRQPVIWSSTFVRTRQTAKGVLEGLGWQDRHVREDLRLVEQSYGMNAWSLQEPSPETELVKQFMAISQKVFRTNRFLTPLPGGESLQQQFMRVDSFVGTLHRDKQRHGHDDLLIISHGATVKNFLMRWFHIPDYQWKQLETPHNCDVIAIERHNGAWRARKLYDGETRHIALCDPLKNIKPVPVPGPH